ncbi:unannotated protein [freshwater metagenome]|uniref:Unannotated protein n=1 Tax=freshwater metagenome TaxID=449393 RepID=A0A6J7CWM6_9ZZZZ|nr:DUF2520 domain-containing protein [Actinomycetota bacterium]
MRQTIATVGPGRLGTALTAALSDAGLPVSGPYRRGFTGAGTDIVLLCVPDGAIAAAAAAITPGPMVGHCSGATGLGVLTPHEAFGLHPLMTVTPAGAQFAGAGCAVAGSTPEALECATELAAVLRMDPFVVADADRTTYHAAASIASNFLVTLEDAAERLAAQAGIPRAALVPLARAALENWAAEGARNALTGPISRGDEETVTRQRDAVLHAAPELLELFDALAAATRTLAGRPEVHA